MMDPAVERTMLGIAHALFINRLHVLRLTEVVRLGIKPDNLDGNMVVPGEVDGELKQQAYDFVSMCFPPEMSVALAAAKADWLQPA